jgi:hypothetical protein
MAHTIRDPEGVFGALERGLHIKPLPVCEREPVFEALAMRLDVKAPVLEAFHLALGCTTRNISVMQPSAVRSGVPRSPRSVR